MDVTEIENTIEELENGPTTFVNCARLADLYIVWDYMCHKDEECEETSKTTTIKS